MSIPEPPERLAEILLEILALSGSAETKKSKSKNFDAKRVEEQSQRTEDVDNLGNGP